MDTPQKTIVCRDAGIACDWEVRDSDEKELVSSAQAHAKRKHGADYTTEQISPLVHDVKR